jgi:hypothetical protein
MTVRASPKDILSLTAMVFLPAKTTQYLKADS